MNLQAVLNIELFSIQMELELGVLGIIGKVVKDGV
jgi:hypothetical protein